MSEFTFTGSPVIATTTTTNGDAGASLTTTDTFSAPVEQERETLPTWEAVLAYEGLDTADNRYLMPGEISERELPLTLMAQTVTAEGHDGAEVAGKITEIWRHDRPDIGEGVVAIMGRGEFTTEKAGPLAVQLVEDEVLRGVSIDFATAERVPLRRDTHEVIPDDELTIEMLMNNEVVTGIKGTIMGATLVPFPAFGEASMWIKDSEDAIVASAYSVKLVEPEQITALTAAAAGMAPIAPPRDWFYMPEADGKTPLTVTDDGRVFGHLATWDQCHMGFMNDCVLAKPSRTNYAFFHVGSIKTAEGDRVPIGRLIVGEAGHANVRLDYQSASDFYDRTGMVAAYVRAIDGKYGIWLSGTVRSDAPAEKVRDLMANPPSGDWRFQNGWLELTAALSVPVPGFPVPYANVSLVASAEVDGVNEIGYDNVRSLVASGYVEVEVPTMSRWEQRRKALLIAMAEEALA
jgi:hypothetical protein